LVLGLVFEEVVEVFVPVEEDLEGVLTGKVRFKFFVFWL
jgi:hypothetical protein